MAYIKESYRQGALDHVPHDKLRSVNVDSVDGELLNECIDEFICEFRPDEGSNIQFSARLSKDCGRIAKRYLSNLATNLDETCNAHVHTM